jgi:hypothetical protein
LERIGNAFNASVSTNGSTWTPCGSINIPMGSTIYTGIAGASSDNLSTVSAGFDFVDNLLVNPGFENASGGWTAGGTAGQASWGGVSVSNINSGLKAARVGVQSANLYQDVSNFRANRRHRATAWVKLSYVGDTGYVGVEARSSTGAVLGTFQTACTWDTYRKVETTFSVPVGTSTLRSFVRKNNGTQYFYADDVTLEEL